MTTQTNSPYFESGVTTLTCHRKGNHQESQVASFHWKNHQKDKCYLGALEGRNLSLNGFRFDRFSSQLILKKNECLLKNFEIVDSAGCFSAEKIKITQNKESQKIYRFSIPSLEITDFKIDHLSENLKENDSYKFLNHLAIEKTHLKNLQGELPLKLPLLEGEGEIQFVYHQPKTLPTELFSIPNSLLKELQIDPSLFVPISGIVFFTIKDNRINLTKLKNFYSEGKLSKFILDKSNQSFLDLNGTLELYIKMKPTALVFKLTKSFLLQIKGNIGNPSYSLKRQEE